MEQLERIKHMEDILDRSKQVIFELEEALGKYKDICKEIQELETYYEGPLWRKDYEDDEAGKIPQDMKRGVLSEDAVYNLISYHEELIEELASVVEEAYSKI
ncbi:MAG: DUF4298 domain-containing protein [Erysipelotrichales bacterium]|nr:DUF4298 domain-containing protein [Erysipelotrichales bacterium]